MQKNTTIEIQQVSNGFIVRPGYQAEFGNGRAMCESDISVFSTQIALNRFLTKRFAKEESNETTAN